MTATTDALLWQARQCAELGSPFSAGLLTAAAEGALGPLENLFAAWEGQPVGTHIGEATPLRLLGALHHLVLTGKAPALAALYPEASASTDWLATIATARRMLIEKRAAIAAFMTSPPQTNEVGRSLCLAPGFLKVAAHTGLPLSILEIGASAGLNLRWDRYRYDFAGRDWGDPDSPVRLAADWKGTPLRDMPAVAVVARAACDQNPIDVTDDDAALRLQAYVWADQPARMDRLRGAIAVARATPANLFQADAADWVAANLSPSEGVATVLFHSVMWQYMPQRTQNAVSEAIARAAELATEACPLAHLSMEPDLSREGFPMAVRLTIWPNGHSFHLADVHPHGAWMRWLVD
ncbi:MAG: DUF2332 domain-containing protein [Hyphomicrobiales bacterium]|nr:DUF2332 domain-containing protein [Caulobacter sp.]RYE86176.1 MAG: DUF2332 domain-containing protein [Hyphomicrobiales bacterium]